METLWQDLRQGARSLFKQPTFTIVAVVTLALGVGANTAIFSVVHAVLLQSLPYRDADRLVSVWERSRRGGNAQNVINMGNFFDWKEQNRVFEDMAAFFDLTTNLTSGGDPQIIGRKLILSGNEVTVIGVMPADFNWHVKAGSMTRKMAELWSPWQVGEGARQ